MLQNSNFRVPRRHHYFAKNRSYSYGAKSRWGRPWVHLGANGVPLGKKMAQNRKKLPCPIIRIFDYTAVINFSQKNGSYGYGAKSWWGPLGTNLGPMGSHCVQNTGQNRKKFPCPEIRIFLKKMEDEVMAPNHGGDPLGSILGPMGSHCIKKWVKTLKKLPCPKIRIFGHRFFAKNRNHGYGAISQWGLSRVYLGSNGVP